MEQHGKEDIQNEEGTETQMIVEETRPRRGRPPRKPNVVGVVPAAPASLDKGEWIYRPWNNIPHWVHRITGASTFDLKRVKP